MLHLAEHAFKVTGSKNLCISGGVDLNSVATIKFMTRLFDKVFINPAASDTGMRWVQHCMASTKSKVRKTLMAKYRLSGPTTLVMLSTRR